MKNTKRNYTLSDKKAFDCAFKTCFLMADHCKTVLAGTDKTEHYEDRKWLREANAFIRWYKKNYSDIKLTPHHDNRERKLNEANEQERS